MPIIAVAAAAISVAGVGAAGFGTILAGTASIGTMMAGVAAVGATLGAIGAVAGIDELKTAGMVLGGIGGVGAIANAVGAFGANATMASVLGGAEAATAGSLAETSASLINGAQMGDMAQDAISGFTGNNFGVVDAANNIGGFTGGDFLSSTVQIPGSKTMEMASAASDVLKPVTENITEGPTNADNAKSAGGIDGDLSLPAGDVQKLDPLKVTGNVNVPGASDSGGMFGKNGFFSTAGGGMLGMGVVQAAGSFLSGAFDELKPAQAEAYKAQAAANNAAAALQNKQNSNMNEPIPVARRMAVTGKTGGMINAAPPAGAMV